MKRADGDISAVSQPINCSGNGPEPHPRGMTIRRAIKTMAAAGASALVGTLALAAPAAATVSCTFNTDLLDIQMNAPDDFVSLQVGGGGIILVDGPTGPVICGPAGPPTVTNTETVAIVDTSDDPGSADPNDGSTFAVVQNPAAFAPGASLNGEGGGIPEIEFAVNLNTGDDDQLQLVGANPGADDWVMGAGGINWNAGAGDPVPDAELTTLAAVGDVEMFPRGGDDRVSAQGGSGTGVAYAGRLEIGAAEGNDVVDAGEGNDDLSGGLGNDIVRGHGGFDDVYDGEDTGDDVLEGGADEDFLMYGGVPSGVTVDLSRTGPQDTGAGGVDTLSGFEDVSGTEHRDTLTGDAGTNYLLGNEGDDMLDGGPGDDFLTGSEGSDTITYARSPAPVTADLTAFTATGYGNDTPYEVENLIGSEFDDRLVGTDGPNSITGLAGIDNVSALAGADAVDVRDGGPDIASCGSELDIATADQQTVDAVGADCETVSFMPPGTEPPDTGPPDGSPSDREIAFTLAARARQRIAGRRGLAVDVGCPREDCTVIASATGKLGGSSRPKLSIGPVTTKLGAGEVRTLRLPLGKRQRHKVRRALDAGRTPRLTISATALDGAANAATKTVMVGAKSS